MQQVPRAELARLSPFFCSRNSVLHLSESGTLESHACTDTDGGVMLLQNISSRSMRAHPNHFGKRAFRCWQQGNRNLRQQIPVLALVLATHKTNAAGLQDLPGPWTVL
ncbi:hypothetical protein TGRH88_064520 [Toxoplasma gondii]|uniref:Uncharacterized protein n=1 Tax=Toxoplasma gondii TaxID=5811 RepID=A0A7J6JUI1_TOXGO|nr:hypothetical protein TGRH88_064520 [Toxoplasma gondii]